MTAERTSPTQGHDGDGAETDRQPFTARAEGARIRARDGVVDFGTPQRERADDARLTCEATTGDEVVAEPAVSISVTAPVGDDGGGVAAAGCVRPEQARELADLASTCAAADETRPEPETLVPAAAVVARLSTERHDVTLVEDAAAEAGILYAAGDGAPTLVIDADGSGTTAVAAGATISFDELRGLAEALRAEAEVVEEVSEGDTDTR